MLYKSFEVLKIIDVCYFKVFKIFVIFYFFVGVEFVRKWDI